MSAILHVGNQQFGVDDLISLLTSPQILPQLLRELIVEQAISSVTYTDAELAQFKARLGGPSLGAAGQSSLDTLAPRQLRIQKFKEECWGSQIDAQFQSHRDRLDRVLFSIIQTQDVEVIQELYFRLQEEEADFAQLATEYSQGPEAQTNGLVGPMEVRNLNPKLAHVLRASQPGQISPPFRVDQWVAIARLERYLPAALDTGLRQRLLDEAFERWVQEQLQQQSQQVFLERPSQPEPKALPPSSPEPAEAPAPRPESEATPPTAPVSPPTPRAPALAAATRGPAAARSEVVPSRILPSELQQELQKRRLHRLPEALMLSLVPIAVGGWSIYALFGFGATTSPFEPAALVEPLVVRADQPAGEAAATADASFPQRRSETPVSEEFRLAVNHANRAATLTQTAQTRTEWQAVVEAWQAAIAGMKTVPPRDSRHSLAQAKVEEYGLYQDYAQERLEDPDLIFRAAVRRALRASEAAGTARSPREWAAIARDWAQAAEFMAGVEASSPHYDLARERVQRYQAYRDYAQQQVAHHRQP